MRRIAAPVVILLTALAIFGGCGTTGTVYVPGPSYSVAPSYGVTFRNQSYRVCILYIDGNRQANIYSGGSYRVTGLRGTHTFLCHLIDAYGYIVWEGCGTLYGPDTITVYRASKSMSEVVIEEFCVQRE